MKFPFGMLRMVAAIRFKSFSIFHREEFIIIYFKMFVDRY